MKTISDVFDAMKELAPLELALSWDKVGLLVGRLNAPVSKVLCALDVTGEVVEEAAEWGAELIVAHHPVFFSLESVNGETREGETILRLAERKIAAICMHTNLDAAQGGVNDALAEIIGLNDITGYCADGCGRAGILERPMDTESFAKHCKATLGSVAVSFHDAGKPVRRVCVASGSGFDVFPEVVRYGADTFVTGDLKMSAFLEARHFDVNLLECGHFSTEVVVFRNVIPALSARFSDVEIRLSERQAEPYRLV